MPVILEVITRDDIRAYLRGDLDGESRELVERVIEGDEKAQRICEAERDQIQPAR